MLGIHSVNNSVNQGVTQLTKSLTAIIQSISQSHLVNQSESGVSQGSPLSKLVEQSINPTVKLYPKQLVSDSVNQSVVQSVGNLVNR